MLNGLKPYNYLTYIMEKMKELGSFLERKAMQEIFLWFASPRANCYSILKK